MKRQCLMLLLLASALLSCTDDIQDSFDASNLDLPSIAVADVANVVKMDNVLALASAPEVEEDKAEEKKFSVECITGEKGDTLLYAVTKDEGGWTLYSSDKRTPPVVAQGGTGTFAQLMENDHARFWIESMAEEMAVIKSLDDSELNFTAEEIEENRKFWRSVTDPDGFVRELVGMDGSKGLGHDALPDGHYELFATEYITEVYDSIGRLTNTDWDQGNAYNYYCPYKTGSTTEHALAGCVAIAGAQMLYFLHYHLGVPETAPSEAYCYSHTGNPPYDWGQYAYSSTIWDSMNSISGVVEAPLIANVGNLVGMVYYDNLSGAFNYDLPFAFAEYGISCYRYVYEPYRMAQSLLDSMPVILGGYTSDLTKGHSFIADQYKRTKTTVKRTYEWVWDTTPAPGTLMPFVPRRVEYTYGSPVISWVGMNWGWGYMFNRDDEWFGLTGDWILGAYNYSTNRDIVCDFQIMNSSN